MFRRPSREMPAIGANELGLDYNIVYPMNKDCEDDETENPKIARDSRADCSDDSVDTNNDARGGGPSEDSYTNSEDGREVGLLASMDRALVTRNRNKKPDGKSDLDHELDYTLTYPSGEGFEGESEIRKSEVRKQSVSYEIRCARGSQECTSPGYPQITTAYKSGLNHEHVQCVVLRDRHNMMYPSYEMRLQDTDEVLLIAKKLSLGSTSSYHFFDMSKGQSGKLLTKKSENYIGKLKSINPGRTEYILESGSTVLTESAGFMFDRQDVLSQLSESSQPRKLFVVIPFLDKNGHPEVDRVTDNGLKVSLAEGLRTNDCRQLDQLHTFGTKIPVLVDGNYRLNFRGRVTVPSVKNFQLVTTDEFNIMLQFGKVSDVKFHLDFKAPFNAFQAFAVALSQFSS